MRRAALLLCLVLLASATPGCLLSEKSQNAHAAPGDWGEDFLSSADYASLVVEIHHAPNARIDDAALSRLKSVVSTHLSKPDGVEYHVTGDLPSGDGKWSFSEIRDLEDDHRDRYRDDGRAALYVAYLEGGSSEDEGSSLILGAAYRGSSMVIFKGNIQRAVSGTVLPGVTGASAREVEEAVLVHEFGHLLGLVNNGIRMVTAHEDATHAGHSDNAQSVMYWKVDTSDIVSYLQNGLAIPKEFDSEDQADMRAAGGKG